MIKGRLQFCFIVSTVNVNSSRVTVLPPTKKEKIDNINQIASKNPDISIDSLAGQWMMIIKDTEESLIAMFSQDCTELKHCIWTKDKFLSFVLFNGAIYEFHYTKIHERIFDDKDNKINRVKEVVTSQQNVIKFLQNIEKDVHKK